MDSIVVRLKIYIKADIDTILRSFKFNVCFIKKLAKEVIDGKWGKFKFNVCFIKNCS